MRADDLTRYAWSRMIGVMPRPNGAQWRRARASRDLTSDQAARVLGIQGGSLRSIELQLQPVSDRLAHRAARLYRCDVNLLLLPAAEEVPDNPPSKEQRPEEHTAPPKRKPRENERGPKRPSGAAA